MDGTFQSLRSPTDSSRQVVRPCTDFCLSDMDSADRAATQDVMLVYQILYGPVIFFAKAALLVLYLRLFSPNRLTRYLIYIGLVVKFAMYLTTTITAGVLCLPRPGESWLTALLSARCRKTLSMTYIQGIFNVVSDFYILILAIPAVLKLQLHLRKKLGVCAIFMTGFF